MATIKKAFQPLHEALKALTPNTTVKSILDNPVIMKLMEASKGGFSGEDSFVEIGGIKVARKCAMLGAIFAHDNTDKEASFFYKNGSYMIGAEIVKANARKQWEMDREDREQELEDQMLDGTLKPLEWKEAVKEVQAETFDYTMSDEQKTALIADFDGYATEAEFTEAHKAEAVPAFTDYEDVTKALRALAPQRKKEEPAVEAEADEPAVA